MCSITHRLHIQSAAPDPQAIAEAAAVIRAGGLVAFPTETVYGLGANALDAVAVQRIFAAKDRPAADPLIVHLYDAHDLPMVAAEIPPIAGVLARRFWPGPLTLILPRGTAIPLVVTGERATVAVRVPGHPVARALIRAAATPVAAPSANRFGHTSPTTADHVLADLDGRIDMVLDGGPTPIGVESTVLDLTASVPTVLRPGGVRLSDLSAVIGSVALDLRSRTLEHDLVGPGMLDRHYAPDSTLWLCRGSPDAALEWLREQSRTLLAQGQRVGLLVCDEDATLLKAPGLDIELLGSAEDNEQIARRLYAALRALDARRPDIILARDFGETGLALAISDRLMRAAQRIEELKLRRENTA